MNTNNLDQLWTPFALSLMQVWDILITACFIPNYKQNLKSAKLVANAMRWTSEEKLELQLCFDCTGWSAFKTLATDLNELTDIVTSPISFCEYVC